MNAGRRVVLRGMALATALSAAGALTDAAPPSSQKAAPASQTGKPVVKAAPASRPAKAVVPEVRKPVGPTVDDVFGQINRLDAKALLERWRKTSADVARLTTEVNSLRVKTAAADAEIPELAAKTRVLEAVIKARGSHAVAVQKQEKRTAIDAALEPLLRMDEKQMQDALKGMKTRLDALTAEQVKSKQRLSASSSELAKLAPQGIVLEALVKARGIMPPPVVASRPTAPAPKQKTVAAPGKKAEAPTMKTASPPAKSNVVMKKPALTFIEHVQPILNERCVGCHNADKARGGLSLDSYSAMMAGGGSGAVVVAGSAERSRLFRLVSHAEEPYMPYREAKLADGQIDVIRRWIDGGAAEDSKSLVMAPAAPPKSSAPVRAVVTGIAHAEAVMPVGLSHEAVRVALSAEPMRAIAVAPAAPLLAAAGKGQVLFFDVEKGAFLGAADLADWRIEQLAFSADGTMLAAAVSRPGKSGAGVLLDVATGRIAAVFDRLFDSALTTAISPDNGMVAVGGTNRKLRVFDTASGAKMFEITAHHDWVTACSFSPDGLLLASADRAGTVMVWEADTGRPQFQLRGHVGEVTAACFSSDSQRLVTSGVDGTVRVWEMESGRQVRSWTAHAGAVLSASMCGAGEIATSGADGAVKLWRLDGGAIRTLGNMGEWAYCVAGSRDGKYVLAGNWSGAVTEFDGKSGKVVRQLSTDVH